jgi:hypothetical protein
MFSSLVRTREYHQSDECKQESSSSEAFFEKSTKFKINRHRCSYLGLGENIKYVTKNQNKEVIRVG